MMEECGYSSQHFGNEPGFPAAEVLTGKHCKGRKGPGGCSEVGPGSIELKGVQKKVTATSISKHSTIMQSEKWLTLHIK